MGNYLVEEVGASETETDSVVGLAAAKYRAERRARESERPVVVREAATGVEVASFPPGKPSSEPPTSNHRKLTSDALIRLKEANRRLQEIVAPLFKPKEKKP